MNILERIILDKIDEVNILKKNHRIQDFEKTPGFKRPVNSLKESLRKGGSGIIAEFKRKSPSKNNINITADPKLITKGYETYGATAISVLTDEKYFGGSLHDFESARKEVVIPMLRKDFIVDEIQILQSKAIGADVILLIAAALDTKRLKKLASFTKSLGMETLLEVHNLEELNSHYNEYIDAVGVNNRNLKTFEVNIQTSLDLVELIPNECVKISESGISSTGDIIRLKDAGFNGFLIGENFMKTSDPVSSCREFINEIHPQTC